jgi:drug/metabolite transporter (DMT)-like permease
MLLALSAIWGSSFMFIKIGVRELEPAALVFFRLLAAALTLLPIALVVAGPQVLREIRANWVPIAIAGALNSAIPFWFLSWGETRIDSGLAAVIQASAPIFTVLLAWRFARSEQVTGMRLAGILVGFVGVALLVGNQRGGALLGALAVVLTAFLYASASIYTARFLRHVSTMAIALGTMITSSLALLPFGLAQLPDALPSWQPLGAVLFLGVVGSGLAYLLYYELITRAGATRAILVTYLVPAMALLYGAVALDEVVTWPALVGLALVLAGVALGTGRARG